jgi:polyferredoxin
MYREECTITMDVPPNHGEMMKNKLEVHRILIFVLFAYGIAWITAFVIAITGGIVNSPVIVPGLRLTLAVVSNTCHSLCPVGAAQPVCGHLLPFSPG